MRVRDLIAHFHTLAGDWPYPADTVDTLKAGDPEMEITGIAVAWMSTLDNLRAAVHLGCNTFITHEPTVYDHFDRTESLPPLAGVAEKQAYIAANQLAVYRCHDLWDRIPGVGIPDAWGACLGLQDPAASDAYSRVYAVPPQGAEGFAQQVAARLRPFGQEAVQLIGPTDATVTRVAIGTGAITPFLRWIAEFGADCAICTDDGIDYWRDGAYAIDFGIPLIVVNHAVAEEAGVESLARRLRQNLPAVPVHFLPGRCLYRLVSA